MFDRGHQYNCLRSFWKQVSESIFVISKMISVYFEYG